MTFILKNPLEKFILVKKNNKNIYYSFNFILFFIGNLCKCGLKLKNIKKLSILKFLIKSQYNIDPILFFGIVTLRLLPIFYLMHLRLGRLILQLPLPIREKKKFTILINFLIKSLQLKRESMNVEKILEFLILTFNNKGPAILKKLEVENFLISNRYLLRFLKNKK